MTGLSSASLSILLVGHRGIVTKIRDAARIFVEGQKCLEIQAAKPKEAGLVWLCCLDGAQDCGH